MTSVRSELSNLKSLTGVVLKFNKLWSPRLIFVFRWLLLIACRCWDFLATTWNVWRIFTWHFSSFNDASWFSEPPLPTNSLVGVQIVAASPEQSCYWAHHMCWGSLTLIYFDLWLWGPGDITQHPCTPFPLPLLLEVLHHVGVRSLVLVENLLPDCPPSHPVCHTAARRHEIRLLINSRVVKE